MSHYQGSSYRPGGDSYRPNNRQNHDNNGYGQGRPGDRGQGMRPHNNSRAPQQGSGYRPNASGDRRYQGSQNNYSPHVPSNTYKQSYHPQRMPHNEGTGANSYDASSSGYGAGGNYGAPKQNFNNYSSRQSYGHSNYKAPRGSFQDGPKPFAQKRPAATYHSAYSQTQTESQLWMGDLDPMWTEQDIMGIWTQVGEAPLNVKIIRDKSGKPQYSFVTFVNQEAVGAALQKNRSPVPGSSRYFKLNWASGGSHNESRVGANRARNSPDVGRGHSDYSLFVGDLATEVTEPELFARFNQDYPGEVKQVKIMMDPNTGASKGFGFVRFLSTDAQQKALKTMNGVVIGQRPIRLGLANGSSSETSTSSTKKTSEPAAVQIAQHQPALTPFTDPNNSTISIKCINSAITRDELVAHFLPFGHLIYCHVDYTNQVAHVKYLLRASAEKALLFMHGFVINGSRLVLRWGRDKASTDGKVRFAPAGKGGPYTAAEKPPKIYGSLPENVIFEDLSPEQIDSLDFKEQCVTVKELNDEHDQRITSRKQYLDNAF